VEKNSTSKRDGTKIQMKIGYSKRPDFAPFRDGANKIRQTSLFFLLCFFLPPTRRGGWKKTVLRNKMVIKFK
jgi:hypothetical protein